MKKLLSLFGMIALLSGCTAIEVNNHPSFHAKSLKTVCVIENPKVVIKNFDNILINSFAKHNITAKIYPANSTPQFCEATVNYTALRSWDFAPYMTYAQLILIKDGKQVSDATFRLRANGGLALNKWRSTQTKIDELVSQLITSK